MCPDHQIISLYLDGELLSPWKEKAEHHLASCGECRSRLESYKKIHDSLQEDSKADSSGAALEKAQERVWLKLSNLDGISSAGISSAAKIKKTHFSFVRAERRTDWRYSISLPLPAAAAAAAIFIVTALFAVRGFSQQYDKKPTEQITISADLQGIVPISDMAGILQYLSGQQAGEYVIIQLPETRNFSSYGEPALVRAADYTAKTNREPRRFNRERSFAPVGEH